MRTIVILDAKRRALFVLITFAVFLLGNPFVNEGKTQETETAKTYKIGLAVLKDNPDYHAARTSFVNVLEKQTDMQIEFKLIDCYGDMDAYIEGLKKLTQQEKVDLLFTTGTRSTLPAVEIVKDIPVIFTAVAAPVLSGIVKSLEHPGGNVTGTHCGVPASSQLKTILKVFPQTKRIGLVYTEGESNAEIQTKAFISAANELGIEILTSTVTKDCRTEEEIAQATRKLIGKVDVVMGHQDTSVSQYGRGMIQVAEENKIPCYMSLGQLLSQGALFSLSADFSALGTLAGEQAVRILKNEVKVGEVPVTTESKYSLIVNLKAAKKIDVTIPVQTLRTASKIIR